jgi:hypothetical protein
MVSYYETAWIHLSMLLAAKDKRFFKMETSLSSKNDIRRFFGNHVNRAHNENSGDPGEN